MNKSTYSSGTQTGNVSCCAHVVCLCYCDESVDLVFVFVSVLHCYCIYAVFVLNICVIVIKVLTLFILRYLCRIATVFLMYLP